MFMYLISFSLLLTKLFFIVEITVSHIKGNDLVVFHSSITFKSLILSSFEDVSILSKVLVGTLKYYYTTNCVNVSNVQTELNNN